MECTIRIGGEAGQGLHVFAHQDYMSRIPIFGTILFKYQWDSLVRPQDNRIINPRGSGQESINNFRSTTSIFSISIGIDFCSKIL